jgi:8-oxo-dGTP diphosphatase
MKQVVAAIILQKGQILICQRTRHQTMPLKWEFPGGKIEPGEEERAALERELEEELGIVATIGPKLTTIRHAYENGGVVELHFYVVEDFAGKIQNRIFRDVRWIVPADLPDYDFLDADVALVRDMASGKLRITNPRSRT